MWECPFCGSDAGLFSKETAQFEQYYRPNGEPNGISDLHRRERRKTTPLYCVYCGKRITTLEKLTEENKQD